MSAVDRPPLRALTRREADIFACLCDAAVDPRPPMPEVHDTSAVWFFDGWLARAPGPNRAGLRAALHALELAPLRRRRYRRRLRALPRERRAEILDHAARGRLGQAAIAICSMAQLSYYCDDTVMRALGYDADAVVERGRALRAAEGRW
jgi:hypothetical protein